MASSTFSPSTAVDMSKERDWAANLGMLDWDTTKIVFTKRSLVEFLKSAHHLPTQSPCAHAKERTLLDTPESLSTPTSPMSKKLPRYARFGTLSEPSPTQAEAVPTASTEAEATPTASTDAVSSEPGPAPFRPSRRVRTVPGGVHTNIFGNDDDGGSTLAIAPPRSRQTTQVIEEQKQEPEPSSEGNSAATEDSVQYKPKSRRATSSVAGLWDAPDESDQFKPTRRVRERPGGKDNIAGLF